MTEQFLSQRQFAKMASISPAKLQKLIADKEIRVDPATGKISSLEYQNILMNELKTYKANNTLVIGIGSGAEAKELARNLSLKVTENYPQTHFESYMDIYNAITNKMSNSDTRKEVIQHEYNKHILKEFSIRYKNMVKTLEMSVLSNRKVDDEDTSAFYKLPYYIIDELFTYGRVLSVQDDERESIEELVSGVANMNKRIQSTLDNKFEKLMLELHLANKTKMLFYRKDLSPEFFNQEGDLYNIFFKGEKSGELAAKIPVDQKIYDAIKLKFDNAKSKQNVNDLLSDGFIIDYFLDTNKIDTDWAGFNALLYSGYFANVMILATKEDYNASVPEYIKQTIFVAQATSKFTLNYV